jgi:hypothetical protein
MGKKNSEYVLRDKIWSRLRKISLEGCRTEFLEPEKFKLTGAAEDSSNAKIAYLREMVPN